MNRKAKFKKFISYYKSYRGIFFLDMLCAFAVSGIALLIPICTQYITGTILVQENPQASDIFKVGMLLLGLLVLYFICNLFVDAQGHIMGAKMERDLRNELFAHYQKQSFSFFDRFHTGQLMSRLSNDLQWMTELFHHGPEDLVISAVNFFGTLFILLHINVKLTLLIFCCFPLMAGFAFLFNKKMNRAMKLSRERIGDVTEQVEDTLSGIRVVKSFAAEQAEQQKFERENEAYLQSRGLGYRSEAYFFQGMVLFTQLITVIIVIFGGLAILKEQLALPELITYLMCGGILLDPIRRIANFAVLYQEGAAGFNRFLEMMEKQPEIQNAEHPITLPCLSGEIVFEKVSFSYQEEDELVLRGLDLTIQQGETIALVGGSGVGKTTLCSLIPRFYDVSAGSVRLDGVDVRKMELDSLRKQIGVVQQDTYLFAGTVLDNIRYGNPQASFEELVEAAKQANAHDFIRKLPQGYDTDIGQRGVRLSGGQRQRLCIARVFLKNPPILIFDEATSALDNRSERAIRESLERLAKNRTTIIIAHRLSTVRNADRIAVLTEQGIAEQGTHEQLLQQNGPYAELYHTQLEL